MTSVWLYSKEPWLWIRSRTIPHGLHLEFARECVGQWLKGKLNRTNLNLMHLWKRFGTVVDVAHHSLILVIHGYKPPIPFKDHLVIHEWNILSVDEITTPPVSWTKISPTECFNHASNIPTHTIHEWLIFMIQTFKQNTKHRTKPPTLRHLEGSARQATGWPAGWPARRSTGWIIPWSISKVSKASEVIEVNE